MNKNRVQSWTSIFSLSIGLTCFVLSYYWYSYESSYDNFHKNSERIFYLYVHDKVTDANWARTPYSYYDVVSGFPEVEQISRFENKNGALPLQVGDETIQASYYKVDTAFHNMFQLSYLSGGPLRSGLANEGDIILTETLAKSMFGSTAVIGQKVRSDETFFTVCGVVKDYPDNSNLQFDCLLLQDEAQLQENWRDYSYYIFIKLNEGSDGDKLMQKFALELEKRNHLKLRFDSRLMPITKMHFYLQETIYSLSNGLTGSYTESTVGLPIEVVHVFGLASILIILAALINFVMLHSSLLIGRNKDVGLRYLFGANERNIFSLFASDILFHTLIAIVLAICLIEVLLPYLVNYVYIGIIPLRFYAVLGFAIFLTVFFVFLFSVFISRGVCRNSMKNGIQVLTNKTMKVQFRRLIIFVQIVMTIFLFFLALVFNKQLAYLKNKDIGIEFNQVYTFNLPTEALQNQCFEMIDELKNNVNVEVATNYYSLTVLGGMDGLISVLNDDPKKRSCWRLPVNYDFLELFNTQVVGGRFYSKELGDTNANTLVLNEKAVEYLELNEPVGMTPGNGGEIIGVMKNYQALSSRKDVVPTVFQISDGFSSWISIRIKENTDKQVNEYVRNLFHKNDPNAQFTGLVSLKERYNKMYTSETKMIFLLNLLCVVIVFVLASGIYAMILLITKQRRKEMAIRKINGSSVKQIIQIYFKEYFLLTSLAALVAIPVAFYCAQYWLEGFVFRISIEFIYCVFAYIVVLICVLVTILNQVVKISQINPSLVLKENN